MSGYMQFKPVLFKGKLYCFEEATQWGFFSFFKKIEVCYFQTVPCWYMTNSKITTSQFPPICVL